jgi:hypothetical protein
MISVSSGFSLGEDHAFYKSGFDDACGYKVKAIQQSFMVIQKRGETLADVRGFKNISFHVLTHHVRNVCIVMPGPHPLPCGRV